MGVRDWLADKWARLKAWAHSVPPDVWIGLAIAFVTLIVVYLAYRKAGGSSSSSSPLAPNDAVLGAPGSLSGSNSPVGVNSPLSSNDVVSPGGFDVSQLWTRPVSYINANPPAPATNPITLLSPDVIRNQKQGADLKAANMDAALKATYAAYNPPDESTIAKQLAPTFNPITPMYVNYNTPDESAIAQQIPVVSSATSSIPITATIYQDFRAQEVAASAPYTPPAPIVVNPAPILSAAYAPVKAARNEVGIY